VTSLFRSTAAAQTFHDLADVAQRYFDLIYTGDMSLYDQLFHPEARLFILENGAPTTRSSAEYRALLAGRQPPEATGAPREDQVHTIDLTSPTQALIKLQLRIGQNGFIDYLTLLKVEAGWRIVSKTYHRAELG
jgi:hypothetical protein